MIPAANSEMGRFSVDVEVANNKDLFRLESGAITPGQVRRLIVRGVVDTGAARLVLPESVVLQLGLPGGGEVNVRYADGRVAQRRMATNVHLTYAGRSSIFNAIVEPDRESALIGAIVMEDLDLIADCAHQTLVPRDPERIISEIE